MPVLRQLFELRGLRLVTALFIHADWLHLAGNLLFLMIFGLPTERALGSWRFLLLFVIGGAIANLIGALTLASANAPIVGSSGAVSAIVGAYLALFPRARLGLVLPLGLFLEFVRIPAPLLIGFWILLQMLFTFVGPTFGAVVWWTHIAGFTLGILFALVSRPSLCGVCANRSSPKNYCARQLACWRCSESSCTCMYTPVPALRQHAICLRSLHF